MKNHIGKIDPRQSLRRLMHDASVVVSPIFITPKKSGDYCATLIPDATGVAEGGMRQRIVNAQGLQNNSRTESRAKPNRAQVLSRNGWRNSEQRRDVKSTHAEGVGGGRRNRGTTVANIKHNGGRSEELSSMEAKRAKLTTTRHWQRRVRWKGSEMNKAMLYQW
jgi:hypothetical protein